MFDIDELSEEEFDSLTNKALDIYTFLVSEALPFSSKKAYEKLLSISKQDDFTIEISFRNIIDDDDMTEDMIDIEDLICAEVYYKISKEENIFDRIHIVNIIFEPNGNNQNNISATWFIE
jgi:hypothetical protein